jgi:hypothetical protein
MTAFFDTRQGARLSVLQKAQAIQYAAATRSIERELQTPWPKIENVYDVIVRGAADNSGRVVIDVSNTSWQVWTRVRDAQDSLAEIVGFWQRASAGLMIEDTTPAFVREYLEALY